jgi:hypothetical protein
MANRPDYPYAIIDKFAQYGPSDADIENVIEAYQALQNNSTDVTPVPFEHETLKDAYLAWTPDRKWRILLKKINPKGFELIGIEPETGG